MTLAEDSSAEMVTAGVPMSANAAMTPQRYQELVGADVNTLTDESAYTIRDLAYPSTDEPRWSRPRNPPRVP